MTANSPSGAAPLATSSLLEDIEEFLAETGLAASAFGEKAMGDPSFVLRLRNGRDCYFATEDKARRQMATWRRHGRFEDPKTLPVLRSRRLAAGGVRPGRQG